MVGKRWVCTTACWILMCSHALKGYISMSKDIGSWWMIWLYIAGKCWGIFFILSLVTGGVSSIGVSLVGVSLVGLGKVFLREVLVLLPVMVQAATRPQSMLNFPLGTTVGWVCNMAPHTSWSRKRQTIVPACMMLCVGGMRHVGEVVQVKKKDVGPFQACPKPADLSVLSVQVGPTLLTPWFC